MGAPNSKKIRAALKKLKARKTITLDDVLSFADAAIEAHGEGELTREQDAIAELRSEVARLQLRDLSKTQLPVARDELKTAVSATETAADHILSCAEVVMTGDWDDHEHYRENVDKTMLEILEACAFQDICGQHIAKAAETLDRIEERVGRFAGLTGIRDRKGAVSAREAAKTKRQKDLILHGPAKTGEALPQDDIDALLAG